jgi:hypothetical protein
VFICDECVQVCADIINDVHSSTAAVDRPPASIDSVTVTCRLCNLPLLREDALVVPDRAFLCDECVLAVEAARMNG